MTQTDELSKAAKHVALEAHGRVVDASLAETFESTGLESRVYSVEIEPDMQWHSDNPLVKPRREYWVVAVESTNGMHNGEVLQLNLYSKKQFPHPESALAKHMELFSKLREQ